MPNGAASEDAGSSIRDLLNLIFRHSHCDLPPQFYLVILLNY